MRLYKSLGLLLFLTVIMIAVLLVAGCSPNIDKLREEKDVEGLIKALKYESDSDVRRNAARAPGYIQDDQVVEPLIEALGDEDSIVRSEVAKVLGDIGDSRAEEPLIEVFLNDEDKYVRGWVARALRNVGGLRAAEVMIGVLNDENSLDRQSYAINALGGIAFWQAEKTQLWDDDLNGYVWIPEEIEVLRKMGEPAVEPLIKALGDEDSSVRSSAAYALGGVGYSYIGELGVWDEDSGSYVWVPKIGEPAVEPLIKALGDEDSSVREWAAWALGRIGDTRATEPLREVLNDEDSDVREKAEKALPRLTGTQGWGK